MWLQSVFNAIAQVEQEHPGVATKVATFDPHAEWTQEQVELYFKVAPAIVEPFVFPDCKSEDEDFYYKATEKDGYGMVKSNIEGMENAESWKKICDIIMVQGY